MNRQNLGPRFPGQIDLLTEFIEASKALPGTRWHGVAASYHSWRGMKDRLSPNNKDFGHYSARGVSIDPRWLSYANFLEDMGEPPEEGMTLDRINTLGPYNKANCRWASKKVQSQNRVFGFNLKKFVEDRNGKLREADDKKKPIPSEDIHVRLKLEKYQKQIRSLLDDSNKLDDQITVETKQLIEEMRGAVIDRIRQVQGRIEKSGKSQPDWGHFWLSRLVADFNGIIVAVSAKFRKNLTNYTIKAYEVGRDFADKGLEFAAPSLNLNDPDISKLIPKLSRDGVRIAAQFPGDLITNMEEKQLAAITKECSISISSGESPGALMSRLEVDIDKGVWATSYARAEVIARTETARIQEIGRKQRVEQQQRAFPGVQMYQQYLVAPVLRWPCKKCAQYDGNVYDQFGNIFILAPGKNDGPMPELPIHPRCRCTYVPFIPGVSPDPRENPTEQDQATEKTVKEMAVKQANLSRMAWDDSLKIWILTLPDKSKRTIMLPKNTDDETLQQRGLVLLRSSGFSKVSNVVLIQKPNNLVGPDGENNHHKRAVHRAVGKKSVRRTGKYG